MTSQIVISFKFSVAKQAVFFLIISIENDHKIWIASMSKITQITTRMTELVIKFQIKITIKKRKCKNQRETTCKLFSPKRFTIQSLEHKYSRNNQSGDNIKLQSLGIKINMMGVK